MVIELVMVFFPFWINGTFVTSTQFVEFVKLRFVFACKTKPVALLGQETETKLFVSNLIVNATASTTKLAALTPVPPGATTLIGPVVALVGTVAVI